MLIRINLSIYTQSRKIMITPCKKQIKTNYETQFLINSMLNDGTEKNQLINPRK